MRFKINWASLIVKLLEVNLPFCFVLLCICGQFSKCKPLGGSGAYIWKVDLTKGLLRYRFRGLIHGGAYFRKFLWYLVM